jgi:hypothetical protein
MDGERSRRMRAHPLEYDERGFPIYQPPLTAAERVGRLATRRRASRRQPREWHQRQYDSTRRAAQVARSSRLLPRYAAISRPSGARVTATS